MKDRNFGNVAIELATQADRPSIYRMRHEVYATELGQHAVQPTAMLSDALDDGNIYIVAKVRSQLAGFISVTPPTLGRYSIEKYVRRDELPVELDGHTYEARILTVARAHRHSRVAWYLMYAAFRWVEEHGGEQIIAMGRSEILGMYQSFGAQLLRHRVVSGAVTYELIKTSVSDLRRYAIHHKSTIDKMSKRVDWKMDFPFLKPPCCFHGGAFFDAIGNGFDTLERREVIVNADVLDAWFPPSPGVLCALQEHLSWLVRTSPPAQCEGLCEAVALHRGVRTENILPGAGSSDLIYRAFRHWLHRKSRVLILDPTYGEYGHVLEKVIGCRVDRLTLSRRDRYRVDLDELAWRIKQGYDLVILVNPNNPTGMHIRRSGLESLLRTVPPETRVWIDEAYIDYVGASESLERFAAESENIIVCKTMSKVYALSGMRVGYLCASPHQLSDLISLTPPWVVGLPAQVAAVRALEDPAYYEEQYRRTHALRREMNEALRDIGVLEIVPGEANFLMFHLDELQPTGEQVIDRARGVGVFVRNVASMGSDLGSRALRFAIKDQASNERILHTLQRCVSPLGDGTKLVSVL
ncbi:histidinol-phosphate transaminase [Telmatobacter sp. DSM 110680]|uniref:histidinol-phosphate transaminase n=1 Tax=Telmatobacter sp. DSM 110680 TaxID=3036704 RepID=A0AAU7DLW3_9BACT